MAADSERTDLRLRGAVACVVLLAIDLGCGGRGAFGGGRGEATRGTAVVGGQVVSTVDGHPILVSDVQRLARDGLQPEEALRRLQAERLLMAEAERRGFANDYEVYQVARQSMVQALLQAEVESIQVSRDDAERAYGKNKARFEKPERRASVHVLALLPKDATPAADAAAKAYAVSMLAQLADAPDPKAFIQRVDKTPQPLFKIAAEVLPPVARDGSFVEPFLAALFSVKTPSIVAEPIRTSYGWHAIRVTDILPPEVAPHAEALATLRQELIKTRREQHAQQLIERLRKQYGVDIPASASDAIARLEP